MSVETAEPVAAPGGRYPLRFMARVFGFLGVATAVYAGALVAVALFAVVEAHRRLDALTRRELWRRVGPRIGDRRREVDRG